VALLIYDFSPAVGRDVERFGSRGVKISPILREAGRLHVACFHLEPGGLIGSHEATVAQLLLVVGGSGEVTGSESEPARVGPGCAVFWRGGETHETRAGEDGLTAIVVEGEELSPEKVMKLKAGV
jgi:quercetin dioxygenase-like cupin family protein